MEYPVTCPCQGYECRHIPVPSNWEFQDGAMAKIYCDDGMPQINIVEVSNV